MWDLNFDTGANGSLEFNGDNIKVHLLEYTITLDLSLQETTSTLLLKLRISYITLKGYLLGSPFYNNKNMMKKIILLFLLLSLS
jgi:hypothetical protein